MTLMDLVHFINKESSNYRLCLNTRLESITIKTDNGKMTLDPDGCNVILEKHINNVTGREFVNLIIEEERDF